MKLSLALTLHYVIFLNMAFLLTPPKYIRFLNEKMNEVKSEKKQQIPVARENTTEILHSEMLFKF